MHSTGIAGLDNTGRYCLLCLAVVICAIGNPAHGRDFGAIDKILTDSLPAVGGGCAVMLLTADSVVYKKGYGTFAANPDTIVAIASATKWISAAVLGSIIADGLLNFDDSIGTYLPQMSTHNKGGITLQQCFSHTAGMKGLTNYLYWGRQHRELALRRRALVCL